MNEAVPDCEVATGSGESFSSRGLQHALSYAVAFAHNCHVLHRELEPPFPAKAWGKVGIEFVKSAASTANSDGRGRRAYGVELRYSAVSPWHRQRDESVPESIGLLSRAYERLLNTNMLPPEGGACPR